MCVLAMHVAQARCVAHAWLNYFSLSLLAKVNRTLAIAALSSHGDPTTTRGGAEHRPAVRIEGWVLQLLLCMDARQ